MWKWRPECEEQKGEMRKVGSLVLGTERLWKIKIDKNERVTQERMEAEEMLDKVESMSLESLFITKKKEAASERPLIQALKVEHDEL